MAPGLPWNQNMNQPIPIDLHRLRRSCADCSLSELCLPAGVDRDDLGRLDTMVQRKRPLQRGDSLFRTGDPESFVTSVTTLLDAEVRREGETLRLWRP